MLNCRMNPQCLHIEMDLMCRVFGHTYRWCSGSVYCMRCFHVPDSHKRYRAIKPPPEREQYNKLYQLKTMNAKFDGKHISFPVNGIVVDGKFPDSLTIGENERYQIDGRSLALLTAFLNEKCLVELKTHDIIENEYKRGSIGMSFNMRDLCRIFSHDSYIM